MKLLTYDELKAALKEMFPEDAGEALIEERRALIYRFCPSLRPREPRGFEWVRKEKA